VESVVDKVAYSPESLAWSGVIGPTLNMVMNRTGLGWTFRHVRDAANEELRDQKE